ncbi:MAG: 30S ribosomal protein S13 [Candidatus Sungbacteria bacterium RIFCSPLOWO2_02_FULL_47_9]|uniref:Small ribosomal subunit protein uS13 n=1 Tax=Candidatus Sungbacteria bacterium RIFCSPHIGHO2_01_FULL_47_32 TaxID=1802264 RepID=A0A1G2K5H1_9BACT|nr:MAG: 30S ribosomal protein S13 [Parcubacteria group bacterium GW2011_GWA2_47_10]OGZ94423.1 MAG: 30S ribosomal protein S13 [Candidatus Sungbacteria bacterium RIFCSPHIGHO2_01_FULL_47_32]OGZ98015.1 MAG: 30S ribosomal protein S13 [Candidatus Sungbacteria bacterium RIFCSPHIGHO2_02_FULL_46_12]OHA05765.1 MAG: 30S ribosomal protein S13 [Candidatus Sungbacteria bacterium RIFCSPLOWO2_01_FULL_47_32]OHA12172.1 MAG: 30S ribosomal protein S13 [Candidatus Sungbacteria bacterium RIFCSPLOWO2_02_FULL_47_9]
MRIVGTNIPDNKKIGISLRYIFGVGPALALQIVRQAQINPDKKAIELTPEEINRVRDIIEKNFKVEGDLRRQIMMNIKRLKEIGTYRGHRHIRGLPVRGQRTKTNSRTRRGNTRKTMGSGRKPSASPT